MPRLASLAIAATVVAAGCVRHAEQFPAPIPPLPQPVQTAFALRYVDIAPGTGAPALPRQCYYAHYTGWLTDGKKFDSSHDPDENGTPREPIAFPQGARRVIAGWDAGFEGMRVGAKRRLIIPYQLAYGQLGRPPVIPPKATLVFDVELMGVADTLPRTSPPTPGSPPQCPAWSTVSAAAR